MKTGSFEIIKNTVFNSIAEFSSVLLFIFAIVMARALGPVDYGVFVFSLSFGKILALFVQFNFIGYLSREIPLQMELREGKLNSVLGSQVWMLIVASLLMVIVLFALPKTDAERAVIFVVTIAMFFHAVKSSLRGALRGFDKFRIDSFLVVNERVMLLTVALVTYWQSWSLFTAVSVFLAVRFLDLLISFGVVGRIYKIAIEMGMAKCGETVAKAWPFATMLFLTMIYNYCDIIMISLMKGDREVSYYYTAYQLFEGSQLFPYALAGSLLPLLTINYSNNISYVRRLFRFSIELMCYVGFPIVIFCSIFSMEIIVLFYGNLFAGASSALKLIIWGIPFFFLSIISRSLFYAIGQERRFIVIYGISVLVNILLNIPMIFFFSYVGACITTIVSEMIGCLVVLNYIRLNIFEINLFMLVRKPLVVGSVFAVLCAMLKSFNIHILPASVLLAAVYVGIILIFKLISIDTWKDLRSAV